MMYTVQVVHVCTRTIHPHIEYIERKRRKQKMIELNAVSGEAIMKPRAINLH